MHSNFRRARVRSAPWSFLWILAAILVAPFPLAAQSATGRIVGRVIDAASGQGLTDVAIQVVGTTLGAQSGVDGRYVINRVPAGTVTLQARRIGFTPKTITGLMLEANGGLEQDITLGAAAITLEAQVVSAEAERGTVNQALDEQRNATGIVTTMTREQISRSPDSDAAQAVQRVSGVTVQDGKYVFVRGLGERYTTTSLNGARLPSPEPERRVVPLDMFPAGLLQAITTQKNFTPDQPGDFSGALVDIRTREFPLSRQLTYAASATYNTVATGGSLPMAPATGLEWLGFGGGERGVPGPVAGTDLQNPQPGAYLGMINSFRNAWSPSIQSGVPGGSFSATLGGNDLVLGRQLGYVGSLSYSHAAEARSNEVRAHADPTAGIREVDRFEGSTGRTSVLWGGLVNLSTMLGTNSRITLNNSYNRTADNEARSEVGLSENLGTVLHIDRLRFVERSVRSNQLAGEHQLNLANRLSWSLTSSGVTRTEPDRSEFVRAESPTGQLYWLDSPEAAVRTFGDLAESNYNAQLDHSWSFGGPALPHQLKVGGLFRYTDRSATNDAYSIQALYLPVDQRSLPPEQIFDGRFTQGEQYGFRVSPIAQGGSYDATEQVGAGYAMLEYAFGERVKLIGGARVERTATAVTAQPTIGQAVFTNPIYTDLLPSLAANVKLTETQNLRLSASQTLSRPEYRELAEVQYRDVIGGENVLGNPDLQRTLIQNADMRWEWYPDAGELLSVGLFAKRFQDPIERVFLATSGTRMVTFVNARAANNVGVELEARKNLGFVADVLMPLTAFSNVTLMRSRIELGSDPRVSAEERPMMGQAPYVVNAGLTYADDDGGVSATILYNRMGRRIVAASQQPLPTTYEEARDVLDLSMRFPLMGGLSGKLDAKNLLNAPYLQTQGPVTRESYLVGRSFGFGLSWQP